MEVYDSFEQLEGTRLKENSQVSATRLDGSASLVRSDASFSESQSIDESGFFQNDSLTMSPYLDKSK